MARPTTRKRGGGGAERVPAWDAAAARAAADAYVPPSALEGDPDPAPPWVPYAQRDIDHQRHSHEGLMDHVADVIENKVRRVKPNSLPEPVKPDGAGYMPLYCAAHWIATRGGTLKINPLDPLDERLWHEGFKDLLDRIASEDVKVVGERGRDGVAEHISGIHFASCLVYYPFSDLRLDLILSEKLCLISRPCLDDEHWRGGFDDSLEDRRGARWRRLMVLKADVARYWPFATAQDHRTGTHTPPPGPTQPRERTPRKQSLRERARRALGELYPDGVPDHKSDPELIRAVEAQIRKSGQLPVSPDTILRAAGRRK